MKMRTYEEYTEKDWEKLNGWDWSYLLRKQPQFKKYKKQLEKEENKK